MIIAKEGETREFHLVPAGTHHGVCFDIYDIGLQEIEWQGKKKLQPKIILAWEINEPIPSGEYEGKRMTVYKRYTLSLAEKANLRKDLESWRGKKFTAEELKGFDLEVLIGINAMLSIVHNENGGKTYANVSGVSKIMKGMPLMAPENTRSTPEWIKKLQDKAVTPHPVAEEATATEPEEETPF